MGLIVKLVKEIKDFGNVNQFDKKGFRDFMQIPQIIYANNSQFVKPLNFDEEKVFDSKNPFFEHARVALYVAYYNASPVGRIAVINDSRFNQYHNGKEEGLEGRTAIFGFFDSINESLVAKSLIDTAEIKSKEFKSNKLIGPFNPSLNRVSGVLVSGNEKISGEDAFASPPQIYMPYNFDYYSKLLEENKMVKLKDLLAFKIKLNEITAVTQRMDKLANRVTRNKDKFGLPMVRVRSINGLLTSKGREDIKIAGELYNQCWQENWGFTPLTEREQKDFGLELSLFGGKNWTYVAEVFDESSMSYKPAGFMGVIPNYNLAIKGQKGRITPSLAFNFIKTRMRPEQVRVTLMGIKPEFRGRGLDALMYDKLAKNCQKYGVKELEQSWMLEDNLPMLLPLIKSLDAKHSKTYRIYQKPLSS